MKSILKTCGAMFATLLLVAACAQVGLEPARNFDQQLAYGYGAVSAVRTSAAQAVTQGAITKADATTVLAATDTARAALDAAGTASMAGDASTAIGKLAAATAIITQLQQYLTTRRGK